MGQSETNQRLEQTVQRLESDRFESLERGFDHLAQRVEGMTASVQVLTRGFSDLRIDVQDIKKIISTKLIWVNDAVTLQFANGTVEEAVILSSSKYA